MKLLPQSAMTIHVLPGLARPGLVPPCLETPAPTNHTLAILPSPALPGLDVPRPAVPDLAAPASRGHSAPCLTKPCRVCLAVILANRERPPGSAMFGYAAICAVAVSSFAIIASTSEAAMPTCSAALS